ncbi:MAG: hypothetical protein FWH34_06475 [Desulfovibrionaceae bacterium]|nr:hypothetical protein [Desulfovibrionaceae bacterium]
MKTDNRLVEWAVNEAQTRYRNEVSLLLEHNSYCLERDRSVRYVNTIISDARPYIGLARTFIINGIGYDFNQVSWESFERDAQGRGTYPCVLADADILYSKNEAERQRFLYLRAKFFAHLADPVYMYERGLEFLNNAMDIYKTMMFEDALDKARIAASGIVHHLAIAVACYNQTYNKDYRRLEDLRAMRHVPEGFEALCGQILAAKTTGELQTLCHDLIAVTRDFFKVNDKRAHKAEAPDVQYLADWYQECSYYFRRIYHFCAQDDAWQAFSQGCGLQTDLDDIAQDFRLRGLDISAYFDADNLPAYAEKVKQAEDNIVTAIDSGGVKLDAYADVDEFLAKNT